MGECRIGFPLLVGFLCLISISACYGHTQQKISEKIGNCKAENGRASIRTYAAGTAPFAIRINPDARFMYILNSSSQPPTEQKIRKVRIANGKDVYVRDLHSVPWKGVPYGPAAIAMSKNGKSLYVATANMHILTLNAKTGEVESQISLRHLLPIQIAPVHNGDILIIGTESAGGQPLTAVSLKTGRKLWQRADRNYGNFSLSRDRRDVYVLTSAQHTDGVLRSHSLSVVSSLTGNLISRIALAHPPTHLTVGDEAIYVSEMSNSGTVYIQKINLKARRGSVVFQAPYKVANIWNMYYDHRDNMLVSIQNGPKPGMTIGFYGPNLHSVHYAWCSGTEVAGGEIATVHKESVLFLADYGLSKILAIQLGSFHSGNLKKEKETRDRLRL